MALKFEHGKYSDKIGELKIVVAIGLIILFFVLIGGGSDDVLGADYWSWRLMTFNYLTFLAIVLSYQVFNWIVWKLAGGYYSYDSDVLELELKIK